MSLLILKHKCISYINLNIYVYRNRLYRWPFQVACLNLKTLSKCKYSIKLKCQATTQSPFNYTIHESNPWITSCFGRVHRSSILCSLSTVHYPGNRHEIGYLTGEPHHWPKNAYIHPPQTPDLLCLPLNLVSTRLEQENLKSPNYTSWWGHGFVNLSLPGHHGHLNESECPKDPSSALAAQLR